jgi:hypothetical protein
MHGTTKNFRTCLNNETYRIRRRLHHNGSMQLPKFCVLTDPKEIRHLSQQLFPEHIQKWPSHLTLNLGFGFKVINHGLQEVNCRNFICSYIKKVYKLHVNTVPLSTITNTTIMGSFSFTNDKPAGLARRIINRNS